MGNLLRNSGGKHGYIAVKTEIVLAAFAWQCYAYQKKFHRANQCPNRVTKKTEV